jgi:uncharacterized protein YcgI (DUF1989 family)
MVETLVVPAAGGMGLKLTQGDQLRIVNTAGGQSGDLLAYSLDGSEHLSNGRSFDYCGKIYLTVGDVLWSDCSKRMLTILEDDTGRHDFLYAPCSLEMYQIQYGVTGYHPNCADSLRRALRDLGLQVASVPTAFNFFMIADVGADGRLSIKPPRCPPGSSIRFRAEMDLVVAVSSCPSITCNGGAPPRPLTLEISRHDASNTRRG